MILKGEFGLVQVTVFHRNGYSENDYWDSNWLTCLIEIKTPGFTADFKSNLRTDEFNSFLDQLNQLGNSQSDVSNFKSMEDWLAIRLERDNASGKFCCTVNAVAIDFNSSSLKFTMSVDSGQINDLTNSIQMLLAEYPVLFSNLD